GFAKPLSKRERKRRSVLTTITVGPPKAPIFIVRLEPAWPEYFDKLSTNGGAASTPQPFALFLKLPPNLTVRLEPVER
ncbi:MAG: hypothetical protein OXK81_09685, partial [Chloroflexota bacterium]|nr:hypothetical protein [Chloroflexota bacterium]